MVQAAVAKILQEAPLVGFITDKGQKVKFQ